MAALADEGITAETLAASINTIEFSMSDFNTESFPKGLGLMLGSM